MTDRMEVACDHNGPEFAADPAATLKGLRELSPVVHSSEYDGFWMALTYDTVSAAARDSQRIARTQHNIVGFHPGSVEFAAAIADVPWQDQLITETIAGHRARPAGDVISYLLEQRIDGEPLSEQTVHEMITLIIAGGVDTITALLGQAFVYLEQHPEVPERLLADPRALDLATDEFPRYFTPGPRVGDGALPGRAPTSSGPETDPGGQEQSGA